MLIFTIFSSFAEFKIKLEIRISSFFVFVSIGGRLRLGQGVVHFTLISLF